MKKNFVVYVDAHDTNSFVSGRRLYVRIVRRSPCRKSKSYNVIGASRRRMLRVLEAM